MSAPAVHHRVRIVDGVEVSSREAGPDDGPVLLLLHGFPTSSRMYRDLIPALADRYRVLAPDLPGFGYTALPERGPDGYGFAPAARLIDHWLALLGVDRFAVYLMDFGGSVGWRLILERPDQVAAIVVQNAPLYPEGGGDFGLLPEYWRDPTPRSRAAAQAEALSLANTRDQYVTGVPDPSVLDPDLWELNKAQLDRPGVADVAMDYLLDISRQGDVFRDARAWLRATQPPLLVVSGRNDVIFPEATQHAFVEDVPAAQYHPQETGHFALATDAPRIAALMRDFLGRATSDASREA
jgi:pimeloyl-ACP methyl ester carboxylesterase